MYAIMLTIRIKIFGNCARAEKICNYLNNIVIMDTINSDRLTNDNTYTFTDT